MRLTMNERKKATAVVAPRYQRAKKKEKGMILNEFIKLTGYNRSYAAHVLQIHGRKVYIDSKTVMVGDIRKKAQRKRQAFYDSAVTEALKKVWYIMDCICGKRLAPVLREVVPRLQRFKEINISAEVKAKLIKVSAPTIDRALKAERKKQTLKGRSNTKPGTLLKNQIPIRTFSEWDEGRPGFVEIDLVGHDGGDAKGEYIQTLDVTDVCTGWTETQAVRNKAQVWVFEALQDIKIRLPFKLMGIDSDNGSEFINHHLFRFCTGEKITFTRTRSYRKNDNCFVEQKNYSVVRRAVGYLRYDTEEELTILNQLYGHLRLYTNFFQPVMKLIEKTRIGSKVKKKYDRAQTPYQRVLESPRIPEENKKQLRRLYAKLNPAELKRQITKLQNRLLKLSALKETMRKQKTLSLGGYPGMDWSEKIACRAFGETDSTGLLQKSAVGINHDKNQYAFE